MSVELAPHCWNATSFADPEYVMDFRSPRAFCALAITVFASGSVSARALPHRNALQIATTANFLDTPSPLPSLVAPQNEAVLNILYPLASRRGYRIGSLPRPIKACQRWSGDSGVSSQVKIPRAVP